MRNRGLRKVDAFFNVPGAETGRCFLPFRPTIGFAFLQSLQDSAPGGVRHCVQNAIER